MSKKENTTRERLRLARSRRGLSQSNFAKVLGLKSRSYLSALESGAKPIPKWLGLHLDVMDLEPVEAEAVSNKETGGGGALSELETVEATLQELQKVVSRLIGRVKGEAGTVPPLPTQTVRDRLRPMVGDVVLDSVEARQHQAMDEAAEMLKLAQSRNVETPAKPTKRPA